MSLLVTAADGKGATGACREKDEVIEHLQARLRRAHQRAADAEAHSARGQLEEQAAVLHKACERVEQLEDANSQLQARPVPLLHLQVAACIRSDMDSCQTAQLRRDRQDSLHQGASGSNMAPAHITMDALSCAWRPG